MTTGSVPVGGTKNKIMNYQVEVKKLLYKEKPIAKLSVIGEKYLFKAQTSKGKVYFKVPKKEAENFKTEEPAQLLIRWIDWIGEIVSTLDKENIGV